MKNIRNQRGVAVLEVILLVAVLGVLGFVGYRAYTAKQQAQRPATESTTAEATNRTYINSEYGFKITYPKAWGDAKLAKGKTVSPGTGSYQQLTFSKRSDIDINFVTGPFSSPLDGCPGDLVVAMHELARIRSSVIGWDGDSYLSLGIDYEAPNWWESRISKIYPHSSDEEFRGWEKLRADGSLLIYKDKDQSPFEEITEGQGSCRTTTKTEADKANTYYNFTRYALNFTTPKIRGVNAQYDTNKGEDKALRDQLAEVLLSIRKR